MKIIVIYSTFGNREDARLLANDLMERRLIACCNIYPIESMYEWKGKAVREGEFAMMAKTRIEWAEEVEQYVSDNHPYEVPCILKWEVESNKTYGQWIYENTEKS